MRSHKFKGLAKGSLSLFFFLLLSSSHALVNIGVHSLSHAFIPIFFHILFRILSPFLFLLPFLSPSWSLDGVSPMFHVLGFIHEEFGSLRFLVS